MTTLLGKRVEKQQRPRRHQTDEGASEWSCAIDAEAWMVWNLLPRLHVITVRGIISDSVYLEGLMHPSRKFPKPPKASLQHHHQNLRYGYSK
ncbi:MAG TPA: hypothetical protein VN638_04390, partial [Nitrospiraceae bacterium]|nr:hypothetical protein [Nitrospiraceae bacterium]